MLEKRIEILKRMHDVVLGIEDETAYYDYWINLVPDEPCEEDFEDIASDDEMFKQVLTLFNQLLMKFCL